MLILFNSEMTVLGRELEQVLESLSEIHTKEYPLNTKCYVHKYITKVRKKIAVNNYKISFQFQSMFDVKRNGVKAQKQNMALKHFS